MNILLMIPLLISAIVSLLFLPLWIKKCKKTGLLWEDMNVYGFPKRVASSGGIIIVMSFVLGVLSYVAIKTFFIGGEENVTNIFAMLGVILIVSTIGLVDDLLGWKHGGLGVWTRLVLVFFSSIPLIVINAGVHEINLPLLGVTNLGIIYPLLLIPIGITGATVTYNFLQGMGGLASGQGMIVLIFLSFFAYLTGNSWLSLIGLIMTASLIVFYFFEKPNSKVFPGDIGTYSIGALIAIMAILGNFERIALIVFIPYIIETLLKLRGKLKKQSFGKPNKDGSLEMPYEKIYGLTHLGIYVLSKFKKKVYQRDVTYFIYIIQIILCFFALIYALKV